MRSLGLFVLSALLLTACGGSDPKVVKDARTYAVPALGSAAPDFKSALEGNWTKSGSKVVFTDPEKSCEEDYAGCSPFTVVVCLDPSDKPTGIAYGQVAQGISKGACTAPSKG